MQAGPTQEGRGHVHGLAQNQPPALALETSAWGGGLQAEAAAAAAAAGLDLSAVSSLNLPAQAPSQPTSVQGASQAPALAQAPGPGQGTALPHHQAPPPASVPVQGLASVPSAASALPLTHTQTNGGRPMLPTLTTTQSPSAYCAAGQPSSPAPALISVAAGPGEQPVSVQLAVEQAVPAPGPRPALQSAGMQTIPQAPDAALVATQQNLDSASASAAQQTEPAAEVKIQLLIWVSPRINRLCVHIYTTRLFCYHCG